MPRASTRCRATTFAVRSRSVILQIGCSTAPPYDHARFADPKQAHITPAGRREAPSHGHLRAGGLRQDHGRSSILTRAPGSNAGAGPASRAWLHRFLRATSCWDAGARGAWIAVVVCARDGIRAAVFPRRRRAGHLVSRAPGPPRGTNGLARRRAPSRGRRAHFPPHRAPRVRVSAGIPMADRFARNAAHRSALGRKGSVHCTDRRKRTTLDENRNAGNCSAYGPLAGANRLALRDDQRLALGVQFGSQSTKLDRSAPALTAVKRARRVRFFGRAIFSAMRRAVCKNCC